MAIKKARQGKKDVGKNQVDTYYFDVETCKRCPLKEGCYKEGSSTPAGKLFFAIMAGLAEMEAETIRERTQAGL
nr:recombinase family protein [Paenibacillus sp. PL91]